MHGVGADGVRWTAQLDPRQLARRPDQRLQGEAEAGRDRTTDIGPLRADEVEVGARAQVDDDGRAPELVPGCQRVDEPVRTRLRGTVDLDLQDPFETPGIHDERRLARPGPDHPRKGGGQGRHHARHRNRLDLLERVPAEG